MREHQREREHGPRERNPDVLGSAIDRAPLPAQPRGHAATERLQQLRQDAEAAAARANGLPTLVQRDEWRAERMSLTETHATLSRLLEQHAADAAVSAQAQDHYTTAVAELDSLAATLRSASEPRAIPAVPGEEALEPRIVDRSATADDVLAWVAGLGVRERRALVERVRRVQGSADRQDGFAVGLANYLAATRITAQFYGVAEQPSRFNRAAYERARLAAEANGHAKHRPANPELNPEPTTAGTDATAPLDARVGSGGPLPHREEMERSFGRSFAHVEAHTGMNAELAPLGAQALTVGQTVAFADAQPAPSLVAHEATHLVQNDHTGTAEAMASGIVAPRDSAAEAEADANARMVAAHGPGVQLAPVEARPAAHVQLAPKLLVPNAAPPSHGPTILVPDADHPARRDVDGDQVIQTGTAVSPGKSVPLRSKSWASLAEVTESIQVQDDAGDALHVDITYRIENRPSELGELPETWIHTERKALLTIGSGEHAGATIVGQARIHLGPGEPRDPKAAVAKPSIGADHWAQVYLAEAQQYVNLHGPGGRASLRADAADNDVLAYDDPLRTLVGLKNLLKQQHVAGRGADVAKLHARAQQLLLVAKRGRAVLEREIASIAGHHDPHPGRVAPVRFLIGDIAEWLAANQQAGRDDTEDARQLRHARAELEQVMSDAETIHAPKRDQLHDALTAPVRFAERTAGGMKELGAMAIDATVLGVDALGAATGIGTFDYSPISKYGRSVDDTGASTTAALVTIVNGFADEWSDAIERARNGDYRGVTDVSIDTLLLIDGARTTGAIAVDKAQALVTRLGGVASAARGIVNATHTAVSTIPAEVADIAAAMADGADAFVAKLRAGGMQMATAGGDGSGPHLGGLSADTLADAATAAKDAYNDKRLAQDAAKHGDHAKGPGAAAEHEIQRASKSAAGNAQTNATKKYSFDPAEKQLVDKKVREAALDAAEKAYRDAISARETPGEANTAANKAARDAAENVAAAEAERSARAAAEHAINDGGVFDTGQIDAKTVAQLAEYKAGKTGLEARRLARELDGLSKKDFLAKMSGEPCTAKTVNINGPPPQPMQVYEYPDGTVVRYKPLGDAKRSGPTYSVEVKKDPAMPDVGSEDAAFKVASSGVAVPKGPIEVKNPYPAGSLQARKFRDAVMNAGHKTLE